MTEVKGGGSWKDIGASVGTGFSCLLGQSLSFPAVTGCWAVRREKEKNEKENEMK